MDWRVLLPIACAGLGCLLYLHRYRRALIFAIAWLITFAVIFLLLPSIANFGLRQFVRFSLFTYYIVVVLLPFGSILIYDTNISAIISSLVKLGLSRRFVLALSVVLRFLPTYGEESRLIRDNLKLRGIKLSIKRPVESWGYLFMPILLRLEHIAEELSSAAVTKGSESTTKRSLEATPNRHHQTGLQRFTDLYLANAGRDQRPP